MDEIQNILVERLDGYTYTVDAVYFYHDICRMDHEHLVALMNGRLYEKDGNKYCMNVLDLKLDPVADAWLRC